MKRTLILIFTILCSFSNGKDWIKLEGTGQECLINVIHSDDFQTSLEIAVPGFYKIDTVINNTEYNIVDIPNTGVYLREGLPMVPAIYKIIAIPSSKDVKVTLVVIKDTLLSDYCLMPAQRPLPEFVPDSFIINDSLYNRDIYYPETLASYYGPALWRDYRVIQLQVYPIQFNPLIRKIRIITKFKVIIEYVGLNTGNNPILPPRPTKTFTKLYKKYILNYDEYIGERTEWEGSYLIIVHDIFYEACLPLFSWKSRLGHKVVIKPLSEIGFTTQAIYNYIKHAYENWSIPLEYVLFIGDDNYLPAYRYNDPNYPYNPIPTDHNYSLIAGDDYLSDIFIGRLPAGSSSEATNMRSKIMLYEGGNLTGDWYKRETGICITQSGRIFDYTIGVVRQMLLSHGFLQADSLNHPSPIAIADSINRNRNFVVYRGHGDTTEWSSVEFTTAHVLNNLTNTNSYPVVIAPTCLANNFTYTGHFCMGEAFMCQPKGGVGYFGATNISYSFYNDTLTIAIFHAMLEDCITNLQPACNDGKMHVINYYGANDPQARETAYLMNLLGDPSLEMWTDIPKILSLDWPGNAEWGETYRVYVHDPQYNPIKDALVCIWNKQGWPNGIHLTGYSGADGYAYLGPIPSGFYEGPANLTASKHNYRPKLLDINIVALKGPYYLVASSPDMISIKLNWQDFSGREAGFIIARKVDDGQWNYNWKDIPQPNLTQYIDTDVQFCHKYTYMVRCYDAGYQHLSPWSNETHAVCGALAQSNYSKMSAYNNGAKVAKYGNNLYVAYTGGDWGCGTRHVYCLRSTDGGNSFVRNELHKMYEEDHRKSQPAIAISNNGIPYVVWGSVYWSSSGKGTAGWFRSYYCAYYTNNNWQIGEIYSQKFSEDPNWTPPEDYIGHPSLSLTSDSGYVAFKFPMGGNLHIVGFLLSDPYSSADSTVPNTSSINPFPSIGYDKGNPSNPGDDRIVVLVHASEWGPLKLYYRTIGSTNWQPVPLPDVYGSFGSPSLWAGQNELRITFEGGNYNTQQEGLFFLWIPWQNNTNTYDVNQPIELVSSNFDYYDGIEGYSYLAGKDVVLWKAGDDIHYARRLGTGEWQDLGNLSQSADVSSYPQGVVFGSAIRPKLFALWTEKSGNNHYLVRKVVNLPPAYQYPVLAVAQSDIPEATGFNNSRRLIRDASGVLHLAFTSGNNIYHTFLQDTSWAEPVPIGEGKYPALAMDNNGKIHCVWSYNQGMPYFLEELRYSCFDGSQWSSPIPLMHTYNSFFWGIGAPSLAIK
ncbi:MAG: C25 family cysteine peptidase, partial [candidate division WOR-3 bacterium]